MVSIKIDGNYKIKSSKTTDKGGIISVVEVEKQNSKGGFYSENGNVISKTPLQLGSVIVGTPKLEGDVYLDENKVIKIFVKKTIFVSDK